MDLRKDSEKTKENGKLSGNEHLKRSLAKRKSRLRAKLILINSAFALVIIIVVLAAKVVSLNSSGKEALSEITEADVADAADIAQSVNTDAEEDEEAVQTSEVVATAEPEGEARWLRADLDPDQPMVALTFDDGPYTPVTKRILAVLNEYDSKATFFCVGNRIPKYSDIVKKAYNQGCQLASHTYEHKTLTLLKKAQILRQVNQTNKALQAVIGCSATALRPPGGSVNDKVKNTVNVPLVCWNVDSEDWKSKNAKKILKQCSSISDGDIVLMHDLYPTTADAVEKLVPRLVKQGYQLVTVDELFYYKGIDAEAGQVYYSGK